MQEILTPSFGLGSSQTGPAGLTSTEPVETSSTEDLKSSAGISREATIWDLYVYDCMWIIARNIESLLGREQNTDKISLFLESVDRDSFNGISGLVSFNDRVLASPQLKLEQWVNMSERVTVMDFTLEAGDFTFLGAEWKSGAAPLDETQVILQSVLYLTETVNKTAALLYNSSAGLSVLLCLVILVVNLVHRNEKIIKITSPVVNYFIICGSILLTLCAVSMSITAYTLDHDCFLAACYFYLVSLNIGFTMTFGALFAKTWRVYKAFTEQSAQKITISDLQLVITILVLVFLDGMILTAAAVIDPMKAELKETRRELEMTGHHSTMLTHYSALQCTMKTSVFFYIFGATKALLLLFGGFLAFETRNVHVEALNDSKSIAICIYNYFISTCIGSIFNFVLGWEQIDTYVLLAPLILTVALFPIMVLFAPRHLALLVKRQPIAVNIRNKSTFTTTAVSSLSK